MSCSIRWLFVLLFIGLTYQGYCQTNTPPQPTPNTNQTATVGIAFSYTVNAFTDAETPNSLTYTASIILSNGLSFDSNTHVISGTPIITGSSNVTVTATDPDGLSANTIFTIFTVCNNPSQDYTTLVDLYNSTNGPGWTNKSQWLTNCDPCTWFGVTCTNGRVSALNLFNNQLSGTIPSSLSALSSLNQLNLGRNQLNDGIPASLGALSNLNQLILGNNPLGGTIPTSLSALSNLKQLDLTYNQLIGPIPAGLGSLPNLINLQLGVNQLSGCFPANLAKLCGKFVDFSSNPALPGGGNFSTFCANGLGSCTPDNTLPKPTVNASQAAIIGTPFSYSVNAFTDAETPNNLTYMASIVPGNGLNFDSNTRVISGVTTATGVSSVTITATDPEGLSASTTFIITSVQACPGNLDYAALADFYYATNGPNWLNHTNWLTDCNPCSWYGVGCDNTGRVSTLNLYKNQLFGSIPASLNGLSNLQSLILNSNEIGGNLPASLGSLTNLQQLNLAQNRVSSVPASLSGLTNLKELYLNGNQLAGEIPISLISLTNLQQLNLAYNQLIGSIPASLSTLSNLQSLILTGNGLSGSIPASLSALSSLQRLDLANNQLSGNIPTSLGSLTTLQQFLSNTNQLSGLIPASLGALTNLQILDLHGNQLSGSIPASLGALTNLQTFALNNNLLSGSIPVSLSTLTNCQYFFLSSNQLSGCFPASLSALCTSEPNRFYIFSGNPDLPGGGDFSTFCVNGTGSCSPFKTPPQPVANDNQTPTVGTPFSYTANPFTDAETPTSLTYSANIVPTNGLSFDSNTRVISGTPTTSGVSSVTLSAIDPDGLSASTSFTITALVACPDNPEHAALVELYNATNGPNWTHKDNWLTNCDICGWYGVSCDNNGRVNMINLIKNQLQGSIPASLSALAKLQSLILAVNQLSGNIPGTLGTLTNLKELNLYDNQLSGSIPASLGALNTLQYLVLSSNQLISSIPTSLSALSNLQALDLSANRLSGDIPSELGRLSNLTTLALNSNQLNGRIPASIGLLTNLISLELGVNKLSGSIPASLGNLTNLQNLTLHANQLSGIIPSGLGSLPNLIALFLYSNQLSGCFPASLSALCSKTVYFFNNPGLPGEGNFAAFCANGTGRGNGEASVSATSANVGSVLSLSASGGASYQWMAPSGALLSNPTTNAVVSATLINNGTQTFRVSIYNGIDCSQELSLPVNVTNAPMPVNLVSFSARAINEQLIQIDWTTASEQNNNYFLLERSKDLVQAEPVAQLKAHEGNSFQGFTYSYTDEKPYTGTSYYRLRQVDLDGKTTTYPWESVVLRREAYGVSPNPISNQQFRLQLDEPLTATIKLYGLDGRLVPFQKLGSEADSLQLKTIQKLPTGIYILTVEERAQKREYRLVVE